MAESGRAHPRSAIVDIGSNSVRLVVYQGPARLPAVLFNEKVMAGLGRDLAATGAIGAGAMARGRTALARFAMIARELDCDRVRTVATAAVRDASNGGELIDAAAALGLRVELLAGDAEAEAAGLGVLSGIPAADGVVGDLGGGSLELVRIGGGAVRERASLKLGVLRLGALKEGAREGAAIEAALDAALRKVGWAGRGRGLPFYLVGGSWRAMVKLHAVATGYPLPLIHQYRMTPGQVQRLARKLAGMTRAELKETGGLSTPRAATLADATWLLAALLKRLGSSEVVASAFGLREGLLYGDLDAETREQDPLIVAAREEGRAFGRFPEHGDLLARWIAPLFADASGQGAEDARLRHAACLLADTGWRANPEFRAERGAEVALHGNWVAIDAAGRAMLAQALATALDGSRASPDPLPRLASPEQLARASTWGLAIRLGQRLSGGVAGPLERTALSMGEGGLSLRLPGADAPLYGEAVEKRHAALATALGAAARVC